MCMGHLAELLAELLAEDTGLNVYSLVGMKCKTSHTQKVSGNLYTCACALFAGLKPDYRAGPTFDGRMETMGRAGGARCGVGDN